MANTGGDPAAQTRKELTMARRAQTTATEVSQTKRSRRSPDQIVTDLQAEIERVKQRAAAQAAKANPEVRALIAATRAIDKARADCSGDAKRALEAAAAILGEQLVAMGLRLPQRRGRRQAA